MRVALTEAPYFDGMADAYYEIALSCLFHSDWAGALSSLLAMEELSRSHGDVRGLARCYHGMGDLHRDSTKDVEQAVQFWERSIEQAAYLSDTRLTFAGHFDVAYTLLENDEPIELAEHHLQAAVVALRRLASSTGSAAHGPQYLELIGDEFGRRGLRARAKEFWIRSLKGGAPVLLLRRLLMKLEGSLIDEGKHDEFPQLCEYLRSAVESTPRCVLRRMYLTPAEPSDALAHRDVAFGLPSDDLGPWSWIDPMEGSTYELGPARDRLVIGAPRKTIVPSEPPRAPHILQPISGAFAAETVLDEVGIAAAGGVLLWASEDEYAFIGKWFRANRDVRTVTCAGGDPGMVGRGLLPTGDRLHLRLEYDGERVRTLCSEDGETWLLSAEEPFVPSAPMQIGVYADGDYDVEWVATTFTDFRVFRPTSDGSELPG